MLEADYEDDDPLRVVLPEPPGSFAIAGLYDVDGVVFRAWVFRGDTWFEVSPALLGSFAEVAIQTAEESGRYRGAPPPQIR